MFDKRTCELVFWGLRGIKVKNADVLHNILYMLQSNADNACGHGEYEQSERAERTALALDRYVKRSNWMTGGTQDGT